jgi:hypothetical protein
MVFSRSGTHPALEFTGGVREASALCFFPRAKRGRSAYVKQPPAHFHRNPSGRYTSHGPGALDESIGNSDALGRSKEGGIWARSEQRGL